MTRQRFILAGAAILLLAAALRLWRLAELPPGLHHDEAFHLLSAQSILSGAALPVYITGNQGNEPAYAYVTTLGLWLLGDVNWAGRLVAAWFGLLAVALTLRAGREMFPGRPVGLLAGLILAGLYWHVTMSRWGSQPVLASAAAAGSIAALWNGLRTGNRLALILAGVALSFGLWAYVAFRLFPLVLLVAGLAWWANAGGARRKVLARGALAAGVALALYAPLGLFFLRHPEWFFNRYSQVTEVQAGAPIGSLARLVQQGWAVVAGLVWPGLGDLNWRQNLAGRPALDLVQAAFFAVGLALCLRQWRKPQALTLMAWLAVGLAASALTDYPPQFGRMVMAAPAVALLLAGGLEAAWGWAGSRRWLQGGLATALALSIGLTSYDYFVRWAGDQHLFVAFDIGLEWIGRQLRAAAPGSELFETPVYRDYPTFEYTLGPDAYSRFQAFNGRTCIVYPAVTETATSYAVIVAEDSQTLPALQGAFPAGRITATTSDGDAPYAVVYTIPAQQRPEAAPQSQRLLDFGVVRLLGYELKSEQVQAGGDLSLTLVWQMVNRTAADLKSFVHVLGPVRPGGSPLYAQRDAGPCDNSYPTWQWAPGEILADYVRIPVPLDTPPGTYALGVGWYDAGSLERLPGADAAGDPLGDDVTLQTISVSGQ